jgi:hypothetical protein
LKIRHLLNCSRNSFHHFFISDTNCMKYMDGVQLNRTILFIAVQLINNCDILSTFSNVKP